MLFLAFARFTVLTEAAPLCKKHLSGNWAGPEPVSCFPKEHSARSLRSPSSSQSAGHNLPTFKKDSGTSRMPCGLRSKSH